VDDRGGTGLEAYAPRSGKPATPCLAAARRLSPRNILGTDDGPHFVDFDDARNGPAVQDLWMLLSGDARSMSEQLAAVLAGYEDFMEFDRRELRLLEPLRTAADPLHAPGSRAAGTIPGVFPRLPGSDGALLAGPHN